MLNLHLQNYRRIGMANIPGLIEQKPAQTQQQQKG